MPAGLGQVRVQDPRLTPYRLACKEAQGIPLHWLGVGVHKNEEYTEIGGSVRGASLSHLGGFQQTSQGTAEGQGGSHHSLLTPGPWGALWSSLEPWQDGRVSWGCLAGPGPSGDAPGLGLW